MVESEAVQWYVSIDCWIYNRTFIHTWLHNRHTDTIKGIGLTGWQFISTQRYGQIDRQTDNIYVCVYVCVCVCVCVCVYVYVYVCVCVCVCVCVNK